MAGIGGPDLHVIFEESRQSTVMARSPRLQALGRHAGIHDPTAALPSTVRPSMHPRFTHRAGCGCTLCRASTVLGARSVDMHRERHLHGPQAEGGF